MTQLGRAWRTSRAIRLFVLVALFGTATQLVLSRESRAPQDGTRQTKIIGKDRLVSVEPLPEMDGEMCVYPELMASLQQQQSGAAPVASTPPRRPSDAVRSAVAARKPTSTVKDPRNSFAGLVVDPIRNEVIMAEENNFSILVYDRTANTPPGAALSEPKRMIQG